MIVAMSYRTRIIKTATAQSTSKLLHLHVYVFVCVLLNVVCFMLRHRSDSAERTYDDYAESGREKSSRDRSRWEEKKSYHRDNNRDREQTTSKYQGNAVKTTTLQYDH